MTAYTDNTELAATTNWPLFATLGAGTSTVLTAVGTFWDLTGNDKGGNDIGEFLPIVGIIGISTAIVFGLVVRPARPATAARRAVIVGVLALVSLVVFWSGLPAVLAAGAASLALQSQAATGRLGTEAKSALALSVVAAALAVAAAVAG
jgi:hypothetical protein